MQRSQQATESDSLYLYDICCGLGLSAEDVRLRNWLSDYTNSLFSLEGIANYESDVDFMFHAINVGSNAEGIGLERLASDYNIMMTISGSRVAPQHQYVNQDQSDTNLFKIIQTVHPSYVRLQCINIVTGDSKSIVPTPSCCLTDEQGRLILVRELLMEVYNKSGSEMLSAPAVSGVMRSPLKPVLCIHSPVWPVAARDWAFRVRRYSWPTPEMKKIILQQGCHVVPIGNPQSPRNNTEWRWSFSLAEKLLVRTFNVFQLQCYFLLKLFVNYVINPAVVDGLSSYDVKTIMFHMVENTHPAEWTKETLAPCFLGCLQKLLQCLDDGNLPHYFISGHNLFEPRLQGDSRISLAIVVAEQMEKGWRCILTCLPPNMTSVLARNNVQLRCDCYDTHWGPGACERHVSMVERSLTMMNATIRVILKLTERRDLQSTIDALMMFLEYPTAHDPVHFPDGKVTLLIKTLIKSHLGMCLLSLSNTPQYNKKDDLQSLLPKAQKYIEDASEIEAVAMKLKLATFFYMTENYDSCVRTVSQLLGQFNGYMVNTTGDKTRRHKSCRRQQSLKKHRSATSLLGNAASLLEWAILEVTFSPGELPSAPEAIQMLKDRELQTDDDVDHRGFVFVDAMVYAYYLLAMAYTHTHRPVQRQQAMESLQILIQNGDSSELHYPEVAKFLFPYVKERKHRNCLLCHVRVF